LIVAIAKVLTVSDGYLREIGARVVRVIYDFSRIDNQVDGLHDGRMRKLPVSELLFIA
jgi:hypothetical protein